MMTDDELILKSKTLLKNIGVEIDILETHLERINYYITNKKKTNKTIEKKLNRFIRRFNLFEKKISDFYEYKYMIDFISEVTPTIHINNTSDMFMKAYLLIERCKIFFNCNINNIQLNLIEDELIHI
jgi:hypothetical protein